MQIIERNKNYMKLRITNPEDLWYLTMIIDKGDLLRGKTYRKINLSSKDEKSNVTKKPITVKISVEKINYDPESKILRIGGLIQESNDPDISNNSFQSITLEQDTIFSLEKKNMLSFQEDKLEESTKDQKKILLIIHDRESAIFSVLNNFEYKIIAEIHGDVAKKDQDTTTNNFYLEIARKIEQESKRLDIKSIILASPSFFKEYVMRYIENKENIIQATCSSVSKNAIQEVLKRDEIKKAVSQQRLSEETKAIEELFSSMSKNEPVAYGLEEVKTASEAGAIKRLFITDKLLQEKKEEDSFDEIDNMMKNIQNSDGDIMIISTTHEEGERLHNLGGIAAILRFNIK